MVAYLLKPEGSEDFQQIVDFLNTSHIKFALTENPTIYTSLIQQFWQTASTSTLEDGEVEITATIDGQLKTITEASLRRHLKLEDADGISSLPNTEIFEQLALMGYASDSDKLTFQNGHFSPQWRFLIHTILHCLSPKKTAWEQFSSNIATAIICMATNRTFNFSKMIFKGILKNLDSRSKFLMYPRFIQILLNKHQRLLLPHERTYVAPTLTQKLFSNMRRVSKGYTGVNIPLFSSMLVQGPIQQGEGSTVPVESHHTPITTPSTSQPPLSSPSRVPTPPHDLPLSGVASLEQDLKQTKKVYGNAYTKLIMRVMKLEHTVKSRQPRRRARVVISDTKEYLEDPSKQEMRIAEIDQNSSISLVQDEGTSWIQEDAEIQGRTSADTEILLDQEEPTELVEDLGSGEKGKKEISTANISVSTASATPEVSTAAENLVLQENINEEERQRIARDAEIAKQLQEEFDRARQEQEVVAEADHAYDIDWSDPAVLRYHTLQNRSFSVAEVRKNMCMYLKNQGGYKQSHFKGISYEDVRLIFERVWDQNHAFIPKDFEIEKEVMKRPGFDFPQKSIKKNDDSQQHAGSSKKRSREDSSEDNAKK
ncbi:hypothetical protein Tco_1164070 [Tanacetum coccineum]